MTGNGNRYAACGRVLLGVLLSAQCLLAQSPEERQRGFFMGVSAGPGKLFQVQAEGDGDIMLATELKLGYALSETFMIQEANGILYQKGGIVVTDLGSTIFFRSHHPSLFTTVAIGPSFNFRDQTVSLITGLSARGSIGYEYEEFWSIALN